MYLCAGWEVVEADVEKTYLSTIFCHFWSWMSGYDDLWVICGGDLIVPNFFIFKVQDFSFSHSSESEQ
jgi:hypothetical protein